MDENFNVGHFKAAQLGSMIKNPKLGLDFGGSSSARARKYWARSTSSTNASRSCLARLTCTAALARPQCLAAPRWLALAGLPSLATTTKYHKNR